MASIKNIFKKDPVLFIFSFLLIGLSIAYPHKIINYPYFIDWKTIVALTGLLIITTGLKESEYFHAFSQKILKKQKNERTLAFFLIALSVILSTFLTNDVTLFIVVPLTVSLQKLVRNDISKLIIVEAMSVNIGSTLTPIGNPQNLFLWHKWDISFFEFIIRLFPLTLFLLVVLLLFAAIMFSDKEIKFSEKYDREKPHKNSLFLFSILLLIFYVFSLEIGHPLWLLPLIIILYFIFFRTVLSKVDWLLLLLFIVIFIDCHILSTVPFISKSLLTLNLHSGRNVFLFSAIASQCMSNVSISVLVSKFSHNWQNIVYGVNIGGNGLVIASLANIIALRMVKYKGIWLRFHKYSIPYFFLTLGIVYLFTFIL